MSAPRPFLNLASCYHIKSLCMKRRGPSLALNVPTHLNERTIWRDIWHRSTLRTEIFWSVHSVKKLAASCLSPTRISWGSTCKGHMRSRSLSSAQFVLKNRPWSPAWARMPAKARRRKFSSRKSPNYVSTCLRYMERATLAQGTAAVSSTRRNTWILTWLAFRRVKNCAKERCTSLIKIHVSSHRLPCRKWLILKTQSKANYNQMEQ